MTSEEIEQAIAAETLLALQPGPNDLDAEVVHIVRVVDGFAETAPARWRSIQRYPVERITTAEQARAAVGWGTDRRRESGNRAEAAELVRTIEAMVGNEPDDGRYREDVSLRLGQLRRLVAMLQGSKK